MLLKENIGSIMKDVGIEVPEGAIKEMRRIGFKEGNRPVLLVLDSMNLKKTLLNKQEDFSKKGLKIAKDLSMLQRKERNKLVSVLNLLKQQGIVAEIKGDVLVHNGIRYDACEALNLLMGFDNIAPRNGDASLTAPLTVNRAASRKRFCKESGELNGGHKL